jgi:uncharacterized protein
MKITPLLIFFVALLSAVQCNADVAKTSFAVTPLNIGDTFSITSKVLSEHRRINVYIPKEYFDNADARFPVLYMPDGGVHEDFLHIAGLVQIGALNWSMRPFILVGIENTDRKRDLTGPTSSPRDQEISPTIGGSKAFRTFFREELMPSIDMAYRTSGETAIIGESLAGLFVVEVLLNEPDLFTSYIAIDPSLWWDDGRLVKQATASLTDQLPVTPRLHLAASSQQGIVEPTRALAKQLENIAKVAVSFIEYPNETHLTVYHPAALDAFRAVFPRPY